MNAILPTLAFVAILATALPAAAQGPVPLGPSAAVRRGADGAQSPDAGDQLMARIAMTVDNHFAIRAKVRHRVELLNRSLEGRGVYLQQGRGAQRMLRFEMALEAPGHSSSLRQISDGTTLWLHDTLGEYVIAGKVDLTRLRQARPKSQPNASPIEGWIALGGLPRMLQSLRDSFRFGPVLEGRLDTLRVLSVDGQWNAVRLAQMLPDQKAAIDAGQPVDLSKLAVNLPDRVTLHIGYDDLFPYRIQFWRSMSGAGGNATTANAKLLAVIEFYEVQFGAPVDRREFVFEPGTLPVEDRTQQYLDKLGLEEFAPTGANDKQTPRR